MPCPICASKNIYFFVQKYIYQFYRCRKCKTIFLPILPSQNKLNTYYAKQFSYQDGLKNEEVIRKRSRIILKNIKQLAPCALTLCDVGSGYGFFLDEAKNVGYKTLGIEPSLQLAKYSKKQYKIQMFRGELDKYVSHKSKMFDIVTCIHVVEHVKDPRDFISLLLRLVNPGGLLYLETPNSDGHLLYVEKEQYTFLIPPDHLWIFSKDSLLHLLSSNSIIIRVNTYSCSEHLMGIVKKMLKSIHHSRRGEESTNQNKQVMSRNDLNDNVIKKNLSYFFLDRFIAPLFTGILNLYHKGSILELYIRKKEDKSGL